MKKKPLSKYDIEYENAVSCIFFFLIDYKKALKLIPKPFLPKHFFKNKALAVLSFYDYPKSSIGPYKEAALAIKSRHTLEEESGFFVVNLPVTSKEAFIKGKKYWGFNKTLENIEVYQSKKNYHARIFNLRNKNTLEVKSVLRFGFNLRYRDTLLFSLKNKRPVKSRLQTNGMGKLFLFSRFRLILTDKTNSISKTIQSLELDKKQPFLSFISNKYNAQLLEAERIS
ncbi:MAG: acetoacetate decarboxylase family protein [Spirochaetia bacterium]|nr:acetoacetate decarboxylase family protein [Spirochaetia bacterium]